MSPSGSRLRALTEEYQQLAAKLRQGGGAARVARMHEQGKLSPRERVEQLLDRELTRGWSSGCWLPTTSTMDRRPERV